MPLTGRLRWHLNVVNGSVESGQWPFILNVWDPKQTPKTDTQTSHQKSEPSLCLLHSIQIPPTHWPPYPLLNSHFTQFYFDLLSADRPSLTPRAPLRFEKRLHFSINLRKLSIVSGFFRSEWGPTHLPSLPHKKKHTSTPPSHFAQFRLNM